MAAAAAAAAAAGGRDAERTDRDETVRYGDKCMSVGNCRMTRASLFAANDGRIRDDEAVLTTAAASAALATNWLRPCVRGGL